VNVSIYSAFKPSTYLEKGTPQGAVILPLLSNIFLHHVLVDWFLREVVDPTKATLTSQSMWTLQSTITAEVVCRAAKLCARRAKASLACNLFKWIRAEEPDEVVSHLRICEWCAG